jgi:hypothetical protein
VTVAARLQATWLAKGAWALRLAGELGVEFNPSSFRVEELGVVHQVDRFLPSASAVPQIWPPGDGVSAERSSFEPPVVSLPALSPRPGIG